MCGARMRGSTSTQMCANYCNLFFFFRFSFVANLRITVDAVVRQRDQAERVFKTFTQNPMKISEVL